MRVRPLLDAAGLSPPTISPPRINELAARAWVQVSWRTLAAAAATDVPDRFREVERVITTSFGRWRYPATWLL